MTDTTFVKDLQVSDSVMYRGSKYLVSDITEGSLRTIRLVSLTYPRKINSVNWHHDSVVRSSSIITNIYKVIDYIDNFVFKTTDPENINWKLNTIQQSVCINGLLRDLNIYLPVHTCFGETFTGIIYTSCY